MPALCPQQLVRSTGALVWRFTDPERVTVPGEFIDPTDIEVLMVHRPRYHDWSWPKSETEHGESLVTVAVREVEGETDQIIMLDVPLTAQRYRLDNRQTKEVRYWVGTPVPAGHASECLRAPVARASHTEIGQAARTSPERTTDVLTHRGNRHPLADIIARARKDRLVIIMLFVLCPGQSLTPRLNETGDVRATASPSAFPGGSAASVKVTTPSKPHPAPTPTMVASAAVRRATQVEQDSAKKVKATPELVDPPLSRFGVHQAFDLIDLFSSFGVVRAFALPAACSRQSPTPWTSMGGSSVTLIESLDLVVSGPDAQTDGEVYLGHVRAFAAERLHEHASPTVLLVMGTTRDAIIGGIHAYASTSVAGGEAPCLGYGQVLVARAEHVGDSLTVAAPETHGATAESPAARTRKISKKH